MRSFSQQVQRNRHCQLADKTANTAVIGELVADPGVVVENCVILESIEGDSVAAAKRDFASEDDEEMPQFRPPPSTTTRLLTPTTGWFRSAAMSSRSRNSSSVVCYFLSNVTIYYFYLGMNYCIILMATLSFTILVITHA